MSCHQRDHSVPTGAKAVHPGGSPSIHSHRSGVGCPTRSCIRRYAGHFRIEGAPWFAFAVGVGKKEAPTPSVRPTKVRNIHFCTLMMEPEQLKVGRNHGPRCPADILQKYPGRLGFPDDSGNLGPKVNDDRPPF